MCLIIKGAQGNRHVYICEQIRIITFIYIAVFFHKTIRETSHESADNSTSILALATSGNVAQNGIGSILYWVAKGGQGM